MNGTVPLTTREQRYQNISAEARKSISPSPSLSSSTSPAASDPLLIPDDMALTPGSTDNDAEDQITNHNIKLRYPLALLTETSAFLLESRPSSPADSAQALLTVEPNSISYQGNEPHIAGRYLHLSPTKLWLLQELYLLLWILHRVSVTVMRYYLFSSLSLPVLSDTELEFPKHMIIRAVVGPRVFGKGLYQVVTGLGVQFLVWHLPREQMEKRDVLVEHGPFWTWVLVDLAVACLPGNTVGAFWEVLGLGMVALLTLMTVVAVGWEWKGAVYVVLKQSVAGRI